MKNGSRTGDGLHIPSHLLAFHTAQFLKISCSSSDKINRSAFRQRITIDPDAFSSTKNMTQHFFISDCDLSRLNLIFLDGFDQLISLSVYLSSNVGMANWHHLPPLVSLETLTIEDDQLTNYTLPYNLPNLKCGIVRLTVMGIGFSGDEIADRIFQWFHQSSEETLTTVDLVSWGSLTRIPRWLSLFKNLNRLEIICNNFKMQVINENSIIFISIQEKQKLIII